jgi:hypothetical protein
MIQRTSEQNLQRLQLKKWEQQLHERELHIVECELKLLMATNNKERNHHHQTPKIQKRSGHFMRTFLNGNTSVSPTTNTIISSPTSNFSTSKTKDEMNIFRFSSFDICMS